MNNKNDAKAQTTALFHCKLLFVSFLFSYYPPTLIWHLFTCTSPHVYVSTHSLLDASLPVQNGSRSSSTNNKCLCRGFWRSGRQGHFLVVTTTVTFHKWKKKKKGLQIQVIICLKFCFSSLQCPGIHRSLPLESLHINNCTFLQTNRKLQLSGSRSKLLYR